VDEVVWGCLSNGCSDDKKIYGLPVGASEESELHLVMDANVSNPIQCLLPFYLISFSFKRIDGGHFPGMVTMTTHNHFMEMRRLTRDQIPFLLDMPPKSTTMAW
jgi:hypothetical protein